MVRLIKLRVVRNDVEDEDTEEGEETKAVELGTIEALALRAIGFRGQRHLNQGRCAYIHRFGKLTAGMSSVNDFHGNLRLGSTGGMNSRADTLRQ